MEERPDDSPLDSLDLETLLRHWPAHTAQTIARAVAAGKLKAYSPAPGATFAHYFADEAVAALGEPTGPEAAKLNRGARRPIPAAVRALDLDLT